MNDPFAYQNDLTNAASEMDGYFRGQAGALAEAQKTPLAEKAKALAKRGQDIAKAASDTQSAIELGLGAPMGPVITKTIVQPIFDKLGQTKIGQSIKGGIESLKGKVQGVTDKVQGVVNKVKGAAQDAANEAKSISMKAQGSLSDAQEQASQAAREVNSSIGRGQAGTGYDTQASDFLKADPTDLQTSRLKNLMNQDGLPKVRTTAEQDGRLNDLLGKGRTRNIRGRSAYENQNEDGIEMETKRADPNPELDAYQAQEKEANASAEARNARNNPAAEEADPELERSLSVATRNARTGFAETGRGTDESNVAEQKIGENEIGGEGFADRVAQKKGVSFGEAEKGDAPNAPGSMEPRPRANEEPSPGEGGGGSAEAAQEAKVATSEQANISGETKSADNAAQSASQEAQSESSQGITDAAKATETAAPEVEAGAEEGGELVAEEAVADSLGPVGWLVGAGLAIAGVVSAVGSSNDNAAANQQQHLADAVQLPKSPAVNFAGKLVVPVHSAVASE